MTLRQWFQRWLTGKPHFIIGKGDDHYLLRWYVLPRNRWFNIYLHKFLRDDDDRALHDHPWWFVSVMVAGKYTEQVTGNQFVHRTAPSVVYRPALHRHRVILPRNTNDQPVPCWTLVATGRKVREWGFWCPQGFVVWTDFTRPENYGEIGKGCDQ